jgi:hypothetical protein
MTSPTVLAKEIVRTHDATHDERVGMVAAAIVACNEDAHNYSDRIDLWVAAAPHLAALVESGHGWREKMLELVRVELADRGLLKSKARWAR